MPRLQVSKKMRFDIFKRDQFQCQYCGAHPSETVWLEVDHVRAVSDGGTNEADNLVTACFDCNRGKGAEPLTSVPPSLEAKASQVAEREAQIHAYYEILEAKKQRLDDEQWTIAEIYMKRFGKEDILRSEFASIGRFLDQLNFYEVQEAMVLACDRVSARGGAFRYFCKVCWNKIKGAVVSVPTKPKHDFLELAGLEYDFPELHDHSTRSK